ncbi:MULTISPECIES: hypothetical protein [Ensifer]|uniref:Uncharacterized protein n=1 Tax=Ensifer canadensis TaxID=555315 RepID=A0AAW4FPL5_9HYPH|nr:MULTISPECIES: hypothetical protein [Ensifer]MDP9630545.1 hypothetical protein [Ensifer adhaerens]KQU85940.1 hypothetical protein ASD00_05890 [Ensifer sp. Root31]KQW74685.1 hypothetical protein ASD03_09110 [Ensifer sp. Root127]KQY61906.1 hypothetical protein ASD52_14765 [Ensifer sp. Root142]MBM3093260.1 hypothetical protein [Ensifer canadensis]
MTRCKGHLRIAVRIVAAFALVFLSFAHKPAMAKSLTPAEIAAYQLPDGTIADICFGMDGIDNGKSPSMAPVCEACRLAVAALLPTPPQHSERAETGNWLADLHRAQDEITVRHLRLLPPPRGPPHQS